MQNTKTREITGKLAACKCIHTQFTQVYMNIYYMPFEDLSMFRHQLFLCQLSII